MEEIRVCLVGEISVGKTTICLDILKQKRYPRPTIGVEFFTLRHNEYKINLWDTAGEEKYRALLPLYLRKAKIILYVINCQNLNREDYQYWINYIKTNAEENCQIIIILTFCDVSNEYKKNIIYLKNYFPESKILYRFNNNISKSVLQTIIETYQTNKNKYHINYDNLELEKTPDIFNRKISCCFK